MKFKKKESISVFVLVTCDIAVCILKSFLLLPKNRFTNRDVVYMFKPYLSDITGKAEVLQSVMGSNIVGVSK